jgi:acetolactate synthase-1/2/3 large subunit
MELKDSSINREKELNSESTDGIQVKDWIANFLVSRACTSVFMLSGGMTAFLADAMANTQKIELVNLKHEQSAGFAAEVNSRVSGKISVAMATSGPGATNLITPIASCWFDSTPCVFITGQVNSEELRINMSQRQNGFQELDIVTLTESITKWSVRVTSAEEIPELFQKAWQIALAGRPGPVLLDIPIDIQQANIRGTNPKIQREINTTSPIEGLDNFLEELNHSIHISENSLILAGGGIRTAGAVESFRDFVNKTNIPVVTSLMGKDLLPTDHPLNLGVIGSYGNRWANRALKNAECVIALGSRLDVRQIPGKPETFTKNKKIFRVDVDPSELNGRIKSNFQLEAHLNSFFREIIPLVATATSANFQKNIRTFKSLNPQAKEQARVFDLNPNEFLYQISSNLRGSNGYIVDVGQHQMWASQSIKILDGQRFITSGGLGAMGFALPGSVGAAHVSKGKWVVIIGDGCLQLSLSELQTIAAQQLDVLIICMNNYQHGMVAQFQEENMESRYIGTRVGYNAPDFTKISNAFGIPSIIIEKHDELNFKFYSQLSKPGPLFIDVQISNEAKALPKVNSSN